MFGKSIESPTMKSQQISFSSKLTNESSRAQIPTIDSRLSSSNSVYGRMSNEEIDSLKSLLDERNKLIDKFTVENSQLKQTLEVEKQKLNKEINDLHNQIDSLKAKVTSIERNLSETKEILEAKSIECNDLNSHLNEERANNHVIKQQLNSMDNTIKLKDELISKYQKDLYNYTQNEKTHLEMINRLQSENNALTDSSKEMNQSNVYDEIEHLKEILADTERDLSEKMIAYEKCLLDIAEHEKTIFHLNDVLTDSKTAKSVEELRIEIRTNREKNDELKRENEQLKQQLLQSQRTECLADETTIDEIADRVEKELNYSAQLDSNIMKAIESDGNGSDKENLFNRNDTDIEAIRMRNKQLESKIEKLQQSLECEREKSILTRKQDATCIETMSKRLEAAIQNENELSKSLEQEREKSARLSTKMLEEQFERSKNASTLSLNESPMASPRRLPKSNEIFDQDLLKRQNDELKLLKSQLEREKERSMDIGALVREKSRLEKELSEHKTYSDGIKDELNRIIRENQLLQNELDQTQER